MSHTPNEQSTALIKISVGPLEARHPLSGATNEEAWQMEPGTDTPPGIGIGRLRMALKIGPEKAYCVCSLQLSIRSNRAVCRSPKARTREACYKSAAL